MSAGTKRARQALQNANCKLQMRYSAPRLQFELCNLHFAICNAFCASPLSYSFRPAGAARQTLPLPAACRWIASTQSPTADPGETSGPPSSNISARIRGSCPHRAVPEASTRSEYRTDHPGRESLCAAGAPTRPESPHSSAEGPSTPPRNRRHPCHPKPTRR